MKTTNQPHWSCRIVRAWVAWGGSRDHGPAARHAANCPACQEYFAAAVGLDAALRRDAVRAAATPSPELEQRILRELARTTHPAPARPARRGWTLAGVGVGAAAAAVVVVFAWRGADLRKHPGRPPVAVETKGAPVVSSRPVSPALATTAPGAPVVLPATVTKLLDKDPLQTEVNSVYADARTAVRFLALNFLPTSANGRNGLDAPPSAGS